MKRRSKRRIRAQVARALNDHTKPLGGRGRSFLKREVSRHPGWPEIRNKLDVNIADVWVKDLLAVADLLNINSHYLEVFEGV